MKDRALAQSLALVAQLGFAIACPMVVFIGGGAWLDGQAGTAPWLLFAGIALGLLAAAGALYRLAKLPAARRTRAGETQTGVAEQQDRGTDSADTIDGL